MRRKEWIVQFFFLHLSTFLKLGVVRSSSLELFARLMNASTPTCFSYQSISAIFIIIFLIVPPVHRHPRSLEQLPPPSRPVKQLWELTIVSKLPQIVVLSFCLHLMFNLVDPVDVFYLLYRDPHVPIWVPFLQAILMLKSWLQGHPKLIPGWIQFPVLCRGSCFFSQLTWKISYSFSFLRVSFLCLSKRNVIFSESTPKNLWFQYWMHCHLEIEISLSFYPTGMEVRLALT